MEIRRKLNINGIVKVGISLTILLIIGIFLFNILNINGNNTLEKKRWKM